MKNLTLYPKLLIVYAALQAQVHFSFSQPPADYSFTSPVLISGTDKAVGALYRFSNVKTGVDALVTITNMVNATLATLDQTGQGWNAAFQPNITVPSMKNGYVEFRIDFVTAGTSTLLPQAEVAATALDIDGYNFSANQKLYEYEQFDMGDNSYVEYEFTGTDINVSFVGTAVKATNVGGVDYGSINLSPNVRFTVFRSNVRTIYVRSGCNNQDVFNNVTRQRSFYFARFTYPNSMVLLDVPVLKSFSAAMQKQAVVLNWELAIDHHIERIDIERSAGNDAYEKINTVVNPSAGLSSVADYNPLGANYYRLQLHDKNGKTFYSKIVKANTAEIAVNDLKIFPTVCTGSTSVVFNSQRKTEALVQLLDNNGRLVSTKKMMMNQGINSFVVNINNGLLPGYYTMLLVTDDKKYAGRIILTGWH